MIFIFPVLLERCQEQDHERRFMWSLIPRKNSLRKIFKIT